MRYFYILLRFFLTAIEGIKMAASRHDFYVTEINFTRFYPETLISGLNIDEVVRLGGREELHGPR